MKNRTRVLLASLSLSACCFFSASASATVMGILQLGVCAGGGFTISSTTIDFLPAGGGNGCVFVAGEVAVSNFITFPTLPVISFDLASLGPGSSDTNCSDGFCSPFASSPVELQLQAGGITALTFPFTLTAHDATTSATYMGTFTAQISGQTPSQIQTTQFYVFGHSCSCPKPCPGTRHARATRPGACRNRIRKTAKAELIV